MCKIGLLCLLQAAEHAVLHSLPALSRLLLLDGSSHGRDAKVAAVQESLAAALSTPVISCAHSCLPDQIPTTFSPGSGYCHHLFTVDSSQSLQ